MFFQMIYRNSGLCRLHSTDLSDMRMALLDDDGPEDHDGPDGGSPHVVMMVGRMAGGGTATANG